MRSHSSLLCDHSETLAPLGTQAGKSHTELRPVARADAKRLAASSLTSERTDILRAAAAVAATIALRSTTLAAT